MKNRKLLFFFAMVLSLAFLFTSCNDVSSSSSSINSSSSTTTSSVSSSSTSSSSSSSSVDSSIPNDPNPDKFIYVVGAAANGWSNYTPLTLRIDGVFYGEFELKTTAEGFVMTDQTDFNGLVFKPTLTSNFTVSKYGTYMIYFTYDVTKTDLTWKEAAEKNSVKVGYYKIELISAVEIPIDEDLVFISGPSSDFSWGNYGPLFFDKTKGYFSKIYRLTPNSQGFIITNVEDTQHLVFHDENGNNFKITEAGDYEIRFTYNDMSANPEWKLAKEISQGKNGYYQLIPQFEITPDTGNYLYVFGDATGGWDNARKMIETEPGVWTITLDITTSTQGFVINEKPTLSDKTGANLHTETGANFRVYDAGSYTLTVTWNDMSANPDWKVAKEMNSNTKGDAWYKLTPNFEIIVDDFETLYLIGGAVGGWETYIPFTHDENGIYTITYNFTNSAEGFLITSRPALTGHRFKASDKKNIVLPSSGSYTLQFSLVDRGYGWLKAGEEFDRISTACYKLTANFANSGLPTVVENYTMFYNIYVPTNKYHLTTTLTSINFGDIKDATVKMTYVTTGAFKTPKFNSNDFKFTYLDTVNNTGTMIEFNPNIGKLMAEADVIFEGTITLKDGTVYTYYFGYFFGSLVSQSTIYASQLKYDATLYAPTQKAAIEAKKAECLALMQGETPDYQAIINDFNAFVASQLTLQQTANFKTSLEAKYNPANYNETDLATITAKVESLVARYDGTNGAALEAELNGLLSTILTPAQVEAFRVELQGLYNKADYDSNTLELIAARIEIIVGDYDGTNANVLKDDFLNYLKQFVTPAQVEALKTTLKGLYVPSKYEAADQTAILTKINDLTATFDGYNEETIVTSFQDYIKTVKDAYNRHLDRFAALDLDGANPTGLNNLALGSTVWANSISYQSGTPANLIDGDKTGTTWQFTNTNPQDDIIVRLDLGTVKSIKAARIYWGSVRNYADSFYIQVSSDSITWETIYTVNGQTLYDGNLFNKIALVDRINARYIQFVGVKRIQTYGYGFKEFQVYGNDLELPKLSAVSGLTYDVAVNNKTTIKVGYTGNADATLAEAWNATSFTAKIYNGETLVLTVPGIVNPSTTTYGVLVFDIIGLPKGNYTVKFIAVGDFVSASSSVESEGIVITVTELASLKAPTDVRIEDGRIYFEDTNGTAAGVTYNLTFINGETTITITNVVPGAKFDTTGLVDLVNYQVIVTAIAEGYNSTSSEAISFTYEAPTTPSVVLQGKPVYLYGYVYKQGESRITLKFADDFFGTYRTYGDNGGFQVDYTKCKLYIDDVEIPVTLWQKSYGVYFKTDASILGNLSTFNNAEFKVQMYDINGNAFYCQFETLSATASAINFEPLMAARMAAVTSVIATNYSATATYYFASYSDADNAILNPLIKKYLDDLFDTTVTNTTEKIDALKASITAEIAKYTKLTEVKANTITATTETNKNNLVDNGTASIWNGEKTDSATPSFTLGFDTPTNISRVLIYCNTAGSVPASYKVSVSVDGINFVEVDSDVWYASTAGYLAADVNQTNISYIKVEFTLASTVSKVAVNEVYLFA